jgi:hypothetical protein
MTNSDFIAESFWDKWLTRPRSICEFDTDDLIDRLCAARRVQHVLDETGLSKEDANNVLRMVKYPIPFRKSDFPRCKLAIKANRALYLAYLDRTASLRDALQMAIEELEASYCPLDESWV